MASRARSRVIATFRAVAVRLPVRLAAASLAAGAGIAWADGGGAPPHAPAPAPPRRFAIPDAGLFVIETPATRALLTVMRDATTPRLAFCQVRR